MKWNKQNGYFITHCSECGVEKKTKKRPYGQKMCKPCGHRIGAINSNKPEMYTEERNKKVSKGKKEWWSKQDSKELMNTWLGDYIGSEKHIQMCKDNQRKATKAALGIKQSKPEKEYENNLKTQGIEYKSQYFVENYPFDFYIPSKNLLVEIDGEFYHPLKEQDCVYPMQKHNYKRDILKTQVAIKNGYELQRIRV
jgi:very-short-patch-repair endonuclease